MLLVKRIDTQLLSHIQDSLSEITDLSFSIYDSSGVLLIPPKSEDRLTAHIKSYTSGREEYKEFIYHGIAKAVMRKDPSLFRGPAEEHHLFIPVHTNNYKLVFVSNAFYLAKAEFEDFLIKKGERFDLSTSHLDAWLETMKIKDYQTVHKMAVHIKYLLETFLRSNYEKNFYYKSYKWTITLTDVLLSIQLPASTEKVYSLLLDTILLLFDVDTVSIMVKEKNIFRTVMASGRLRNDVGSLCLEDNNPIIFRSIKEGIPVFTNDVREIQRFGFPDRIASTHVFPLSHNSNTDGIVVMYNSAISGEESYTILEFCRLVSLVLKNLTLQNAYNKCVTDMEVLNMAITKLIPQLHNPDALYETILYKAAEILKAEKGSLMLSEGDSLVIKAAKGINKWLVHDMKIKRGEGIAGKVFRDGMPLFIRDFEEMELLNIKPKSRYRTGSFISVPLKFGSETMGVLNISDKTTGKEFTEQDFKLINHFASYASIALKISNYYILATQVKELSITDPLTGLYHRQHFKKRFREEINRSERYGNIFSFAIIDIDDFRLFNETEGRLAGDTVLKELARIARGCLRVYDIFSRFGGEEFGILMPQTDKEEAFVVAERIRENIKAALRNRWEKFPHPGITVSIGIASFSHNGRSVDELTESVDAALYKAKSTGKDRTVVCNLFNNEIENANIS
jgi:diguanylate cyclase (GGDEF)-like protein